MAEARRVTITTLSCNAVFVPNPLTLTAAAPEKPTSSTKGFNPFNPSSEKSDESEPPTIRCVISLLDSDGREFPEFNYTELIDKQSGPTLEQARIQPNIWEEVGDQDDMVAIAKKFEEKYGGTKKSKNDFRTRAQDLVDIGYGYDEEDSFIDNAEAYDEFVPASLTTKHGGFYINSGVLQFRQASDTESDDFTDEAKTLRIAHKRKLNGVPDKVKKKRRKETGQITTDGVQGPLEIGVKGQVKMKKKKAAAPLSVTNVLKKIQREKEREMLRAKEGEILNKSQENQEPIPVISKPLCPAAIPVISKPLCPAAIPVISTALCPAAIPVISKPLYPAEAGGGSGLSDPLLSLIGSTNDNLLIQAANTIDLDMDIDLDSLLDATEENLQPISLLQPAVEAPLIFPSQVETEVLLQSAEVQPQSQTKADAPSKSQSEPTLLLPEVKANSIQQFVPLPEGLPPRLETTIGEFTEAAKEREGESKLKFFTPEINNILLDVELQCRELGGQVRSQVYTHLSFLVPCSKETLLQRVKKLLHAHTEDPMLQLSHAIGRDLPEQIARFNENYQAYAQAKSSKATEEGKEKEGSGKVGSEDEGEERSEKRCPQKKFRWTEDVRKCLCQVLTAKMERYEKEKLEGQDMDEYLKTFLDNEVKPLWPKGWMPPKTLLKEGKRILASLASLPIKKTKSERKSLSDSCAPMGAPALQHQLSLEEDGLMIIDAEGKESGPSKMVDVKREERWGVEVSCPSLMETEKTPCVGISTPDSESPSSLDLLAEQALARQQLTRDSQELLAAAISSESCSQSVQQWPHDVACKSAPLLPPSAQCNPVGPKGDLRCKTSRQKFQRLSGPGKARKSQATSDDIAALDLIHK